MLSLVCYMRLYPALLILVSIPRSNLDHMPMALWVVQVRNLQVRLWNKFLSCRSTNLPRDKLRLHLNLPKRWMYILCNRQTRRVTSNLDGIEKRVKTIIRRVGIKMRMPTIMTRIIKMLGGTSRISVRLSFLASFVRTITSLTCALGWMKLQSS